MAKVKTNIKIIKKIIESVDAETVRQINKSVTTDSKEKS